jgi:hypothetical protein
MEPAENYFCEKVAQKFDFKKEILKLAREVQDSNLQFRQ